MDPATRQKHEEKLRESRAAWQHRLDAIQSDRRRTSDPLVSDSDDQAIQRENDETLDALDLQGRREIEAIDAALDRLASGTADLCVRCGGTIDLRRLEASPTSATCIDCAQEN